MKRLNIVPAAILAVLLLACLVAVYVTRDPGQPGAATSKTTPGDAYLMADSIRKLVERETGADSEQAAQDWERITHRYGSLTFSAKPAVNLRPTVNGLEVVVRYITRAPQCYAMKSKLFQVIVDLLHKPAGNEAIV